MPNASSDHHTHKRYMLTLVDDKNKEEWVKLPFHLVSGDTGPEFCSCDDDVKDIEIDYDDQDEALDWPFSFRVKQDGTIVKMTIKLEAPGKMSVSHEELVLPDKVGGSSKQALTFPDMHMETSVIAKHDENTATIFFEKEEQCTSTRSGPEISKLLRELAKYLAKYCA